MLSAKFSEQILNALIDLGAGRVDAHSAQIALQKNAQEIVFKVSLDLWVTVNRNHDRKSRIHQSLKCK